MADKAIQRAKELEIEAIKATKKAMIAEKEIEEDKNTSLKGLCVTKKNVPERRKSGKIKQRS